jgi:uncharacterized protein YceK
MKRYLLLTVAVVLVASACSSGATEATTTVPGAAVPFVGQSSAETAWCSDFNNFPVIAETAIAEKVDGYETLESEYARILDGLGESLLDTFMGGYLELEWRPVNAAGFAQACTAAYESR